MKSTYPKLTFLFHGWVCGGNRSMRAPKAPMVFPMKEQKSFTPKQIYLRVCLKCGGVEKESWLQGEHLF